LSNDPFRGTLVSMNAGRTARERARAELTQEIKDEARRQLAASGADGLSLRAVARELGMVSSALYRYFPSRDDLLTALIIEAYEALGTATEQAEANVPRTDIRGRWRAASHAVRDWAIAQPHEYALIYGTPIPGYQAPADTIAAASRVPILMIGVIRDAWSAGRIHAPRPSTGSDSDHSTVDAGGSHMGSGSVAGGDAAGNAGNAVGGSAAETNAADASAVAWLSRPLTPVLAQQVETLAAEIAPDLPPPLLVNTLIAWSQLFGMISFELFGQFVGSVDPADEFFAIATEQMADLVGLN
jgi:AcrR family transcriptional regulator